MNKLVGEAWHGSRQKRAMDIAIATSLAIPATPVILGASATVLVFDRVNPLFVQERTGRGEKIFKMFKLRTMPGVNEDIPSLVYDDPRRSKLGALLSRFKIDELPQTFNIIRGELSCVGPRPLVRTHYEEIMDSLSSREQVKWRWSRTACKPGVVDPFNLVYLANEAEPVNLLRPESDIQYAMEGCLRKDLSILQKLVPAILGRSIQVESGIVEVPESPEAA